MTVLACVTVRCVEVIPVRQQSSFHSPHQHTRRQHTPYSIGRLFPPTFKHAAAHPDTPSQPSDAFPLPPYWSKAVVLLSRSALPPLFLLSQLSNFAASPFTLFSPSGLSCFSLLSFVPLFLERHLRVLRDKAGARGRLRGRQGGWEDDVAC